LNSRFRKAVRHRGHFPTEDAALKVLYLVATERRKNRSNPTGKINGWKQILNIMTIHDGDRVEAASQQPITHRLHKGSDTPRPHSRWRIGVAGALSWCWDVIRDVAREVTFDDRSVPSAQCRAPDVPGGGPEWGCMTSRRATCFAVAAVRSRRASSSCVDRRLMLTSGSTFTS
jgi:hypothetical protein